MLDIRALLHRRSLTTVTLTAVLATVLATPGRIQTASADSGRGAGSPPSTLRWVPLAGSVPSSLRHAHRGARVAVTRQMGITVSLQVRDKPALNRFLRDVYDPTSPSYRHFLAPQQFAAQFAPAESSRVAVSTWLTRQGLHVTGTTRNGLAISARASASTLEKAFNTSLYAFSTKQSAFIANARSLQIPPSIASDVVAVSGLSTQPTQQSTGQLKPRQVSSPRGLQPAGLRHLYNLDSLIAQGFNGTGQTIAVASFGDYSEGNIAKFDQQFNLTGTVTRVNVSDGSRSGASLGVRNGQDEAEADVELVQSAAPNAHILVYESSNTSQGTIALYNQIVSDNRASVISNSWGSAEISNTESDVAAMHQTLQEAAAQGQTFFSASGDNGAYDAMNSDGSQSTTLAVDYPASDPWVTGVGGTTLQGTGAEYTGEIAWSDGSTPDTPIGTGGGLSTIFPQPSYQTGPGVKNQYSNGMRQVPDVAAGADPNTGYAVYVIDNGNTGGWNVMGGTSAAAPVWAGFTALVNSALGRRVGFLNPTLYTMGQKASTFAQPPFHDVQQGTNLYYPATPGWDFATGWGSFDGAAFVADIKTLQLPAEPATSVPTPTATLKPTATPLPVMTSVPPSMTIKGVLLLHLVNGKLQATKTLKVGEKGTLIIIYQRAHAGSLATTGTVSVRKNTQVLRTIKLKSTTYGGKAALSATFKVSDPKQAGALLAHVTVSLGSLSRARDQAFKVAIK